MSVTYRKILIPHYQADMKTQNWNDKWPTPLWIEYKWRIEGAFYYDRLLEKVDRIHEWISRTNNPKRNIRWQIDTFGPFRIKFRHKEDAVAFRLAFPEFTIVTNYG